MRLHLAVLALHATASVADGLWANPEDGPAAMARLSNCTLSCSLRGFATSSCAMTDSTCLCNDQRMTDRIKACALQECTAHDNLVMANSVGELCHMPIHDISSIFVIQQWVALGLVSFFVITRLLSNGLSAGDGWKGTVLGGDDALIVGAYVFAIPIFLLTAIPGVGGGTGKDLWTITPDELTFLLKLFYVGEIIYIIVQNLVKTSFLVFFLRIFTGRGVDTRLCGLLDLRKTLIWTIVLCAACCIAFTLPLIFQCRPISYAWTMWDDLHVGQCIDVMLFGWISISIGIVFDFWMFALPLSQVPHLQLSGWKKAGVASMVSVGAIATGFSFGRLRTINSLGDVGGEGAMEGLNNVIFWSIMEVSAGIICACMPAQRIIIFRILPDFGKRLWSRAGVSIRTSRNSSGRRRPDNDESSSNRSGSGSGPRSLRGEKVMKGDMKGDTKSNEGGSSSSRSGSSGCSSCCGGKGICYCPSRSCTLERQTTAASLDDDGSCTAVSEKSAAHCGPDPSTTTTISSSSSSSSARTLPTIPASPVPEYSPPAATGGTHCPHCGRCSHCGGTAEEVL